MQSLDRDLAQLQAEKAAALGALEKSRADRDESRRKTSTLEVEGARLSSTSKELESRSRELASQLEDARAGQAQAQKVAEQAAKDLAQARERAGSAAAARDKAVAEAAALRSSEAQVVAQRDAVRASLATLTAERDRLKTESERLGTLQEELAGRLQAKEQEGAKRQGELQRQLAELGSASTQLQAEHQRVQGELAKLQLERAAEPRESTATWTRRLSDNARELEDMRRKNADAGRTVDEQKRQMATLEERLARSSREEIRLGERIARRCGDRWGPTPDRGQRHHQRARADHRPGARPRGRACADQGDGRAPGALARGGGACAAGRLPPWMPAGSRPSWSCGPHPSRLPRSMPWSVPSSPPSWAASSCRRCLAGAARARSISAACAISAGHARSSSCVPGTPPSSSSASSASAKIASHLRSGHLVQMLGSGSLQGRPYLLLELVARARSLQERIERQGRIPPSEALEIALACATGLACIHASGILHRDIKPANILIGVDQRAKLADFSLSKLRDQRHPTTAGALVGTPVYAAPEVLLDPLRASPASDVYSLGATLYHALAGTLPFPQDDPLAAVQAKLSSEPPALDQVQRDAPQEALPPARPAAGAQERPAAGQLDAGGGDPRNCAGRA